ncbi:MAG: hypothetical protein WBP41_07860 [Saprospiraceae bacterium]
MKKLALWLGLMACHWPTFAQVGIGTLTPSSKSILELSSHTKGFLLPRMTGAERNMLTLNTDDIGMMVFQTDVTANPSTPKGLYSFDGSGWSAPLLNGAINGQTLRWDGNKWLATSNLFNQGSSIGIGTTAPNAQLQIHSNSSPTTRLQISSGTNNGFATDGLLIGVALSNNDAHLIQQENKSLWFGTNALERMRIDSAGNVGINKIHPSATLDVNGSVIVTSLDANGPVKIGVSGTLITGIIRYAGMIDVPVMLSNAECIYNVAIPNVVTTGTVQISPSESLSQLMIEYARVSAPGMVEIKFVNMSIMPNDPAGIMYYLTVIQ